MNCPESEISEHKAKVAFSLSVLEQHHLVEKQGYDEKEKAYRFGLTEEAKNRLDALVKSSDGNRSVACMTLLFETIAKGVKNARTIEALSFHLSVLHCVAFNETPSDKDAENSGCDGLCELCPDETCPAKD